MIVDIKKNNLKYVVSIVFDEIFERFGYEAQYIMPFASIEELEHVSEAAATVHICPSLSLQDHICSLSHQRF